MFAIFTALIVGGILFFEVAITVALFSLLTTAWLGDRSSDKKVDELIHKEESRYKDAA